MREKQLKLEDKGYGAAQGTIIMIMTTPRNPHSQNPHADQGSDTDLSLNGDASDRAQRKTSFAPKQNLGANARLSPADMPYAVGKRINRDRALGKVTLYPY